MPQVVSHYTPALGSCGPHVLRARAQLTRHTRACTAGPARAVPCRHLCPTAHVCCTHYAQTGGSAAADGIGRAKRQHRTRVCRRTCHALLLCESHGGRRAAAVPLVDGGSGSGSRGGATRLLPGRCALVCGRGISAQARVRGDTLAALGAQAALTTMMVSGPQASCCFINGIHRLSRAYSGSACMHACRCEPAEGRQPLPA